MGGKLEQAHPRGGRERCRHRGPRGRRARCGDAGDALQEVRQLRESPVGVGQIQERRRDAFAVELFGPIAHLGEDCDEVLAIRHVGRDAGVGGALEHIPETGEPGRLFREQGKRAQPFGAPTERRPIEAAREGGVTVGAGVTRRDEETAGQDRGGRELFA
jgi:hypothetical protein